MVVAFALAFIGTAFLAGTVPTGTPPAGVLLALAAAAMFGLYLVLARRWGRPYQLDGTLITIANLVGRGPILLAVALVTDPGGVVPNTIDPVAVVALLSIVFGSSTSGNLLVMASVRRVRASRTAGALLLTPLASAAIAAVVLGERLSAGGLIGAALILVAMAVAGGVLRRLSRAQRAPA
jgi:drug/metabolite transporter (DMT)-like permease